MATKTSKIYEEVFDNFRRITDEHLKAQSELLSGWTSIWPRISGSQDLWFDPFGILQGQWTDTFVNLAKNQQEVIDRQFDSAIKSFDVLWGAGNGANAEAAAAPPPAKAIEKAEPPVAAPAKVADDGIQATDVLVRKGVANIAQKVAVVTGAASGIGAAVAQDLAERGARAVLMVDLSDKVGETADAINKHVGRDVAEAIVGDTSDAEFRTKVFDDIGARHGLVSICVPAAGITRDSLSVRVDKETGKASVYPVEDFQKVADVNLIAPIYWAIEMIARIAEDRRRRSLKRWEPEEEVEGVVVFLGSVSSQGNKGQISYAVAKAGLEGAAATLMKEAIFHGVRCAIIHPGFTDTPMARALGEDFLNKNVLPYTQLRRLIRPEEIADAVCFMISNSAVSGELWADAGWHPPA